MRRTNSVQYVGVVANIYFYSTISSSIITLIFVSGMFPWVCLATMPLFYPFDWPKMLASNSKEYIAKLKQSFNVKIKESLKECFCKCQRNYHKESIEQADENTQVIEKEKTVNNKETVEELEGNTKLDDKTADCNEIVKTDDAEYQDDKKNVECIMNETPESIEDNLIKDDNGKKVTMYLILLYVFIQAFLPYSHFITKVN